MIRKTILSLIAASALLSGVARADCFDEAAAYQHVNPTILRGIRIVENAEANPRAVGRNKNGSVDLGMMQINSIHLPELKKFKIHRRDLMNSCKNIYVAAFYLKKGMQKYGNTWKAVASYHVGTIMGRNSKEAALYIRKVQRAIRSMEYRTTLATR